MGFELRQITLQDRRQLVPRAESRRRLAIDPVLIEKGFWQGFLPLLTVAGVGQLILQIDIVMAARTGAGGSSAYALLLRVAVLDAVVTMALGAVASIFVARAHKTGSVAEVIGGLSTFALVSGAGFGAFGLIFYPRAVELLTGDGEIAALADGAIIWFALTAPFRAFSGMASFALHGLGRGTSVVRWKLIEATLKIGGNVVFMDALGQGFVGIYISGFIVSILSSFWLWRRLAGHGLRWPRLPDRTFAGSVWKATGSEAHRLLAVHLAVAASLALFAAPWFGGAGALRLDAYAAGQALILFVLAPITALVRYLALRLAAPREGELAPVLKALWSRGLPLTAAAAAILFMGADWLGRAVYIQHGPWWTVLVQALAVSIPFRYVGGIMRAALQARGSFAVVATADSTAAWVGAVPLVALGLWLDCPEIAYLSLVLPEAACAVWLRRKFYLQLYPALA